MYLTRLLQLMSEREASDLFISAGAPIHLKINNDTLPVSTQIIDAATAKKIAYEVMNEEEIARFERDWEMNLSHIEPEFGNFRVNILKQRGSVSMVVRYIRSNIPSFASLNLPPVLLDLALEKRGLILMVGSTGSGKSTSLSAMIEGAVLAVLVVWLFLRDWRSALISFVAIPVSLAAAALTLWALGYAIDTLVLGGFAVALSEGRDVRAHAGRRPLAFVELVHLGPHRVEHRRQPRRVEHVDHRDRELTGVEPRQRVRAEAHHHLPAEPPGRDGVDAGAVHRHVSPLRHVAEGDAGVEQRLLEGEGAAEHKRHEVVTP